MSLLIERLSALALALVSVGVIYATVAVHVPSASAHIASYSWASISKAP